MDKKIQMAEYAYRNTEMYREKCFGQFILDDWAGISNWGEIPLIDKKDFVFAGTRAISDEYIGRYAAQQLVEAHTSGTSGISLNIYWEKRDYLTSLFSLWMERWKTANIHPLDRVCFFNTILPQNQDYIQDDNALIFSKSNITEGRLQEVYELIKKFEPKWMLLHPSMAMLLCDLAEKEQLSPVITLKYIELTGEMFLPSLKKRLEQVFCCIVRSHYGSMEVSSIGYGDEGGVYRLFESSTYAEILDDTGKAVEDGVEGNIYVTSLHNHAMPIIRYGLGDRGTIIKKRYKKKEVRFLQLCKARKNDMLCMPDGVCIPPDGLLKPVEQMNMEEDTVVLLFRAIQERRDCIRLEIILDSEYDKEEFVVRYMNLLDLGLRDGMHYEIEFRDEKMFPDRLTGKLGWFESRCGGGTGVEKNKNI